MKNKYILFGQYVQVKSYMKPAKRFQARSWEKFNLKTPRPGLVVGYRTIYEGKIEQGSRYRGPEDYDYEPPYFIVGKSINVILVCFWPRYKPVLVLPEDIIRIRSWDGPICVHPTTYPMSEKDKEYMRQYSKDMKRDIKGRWTK